jgi:hypothetical protein
MPGRGRVGDKHRDLSVLDPARRAGVLTLHPHTVTALLDITGLIDHQDRLVATQILHRHRRHIVTNLIGVPHRLTQQMLHPVRGHIPNVFGDRPTVLARQIRHQPRHHPPRPPTRLHPREPARHPTQHRLPHPAQQPRVYPGSRGHHTILVRLHNRP